MPKGCSKCSTPNPSDARFCSHCGSSLEPAAGGARRLSAPAWTALGAAVVVVAACGAWWLNAPRPAAAPSFDAAPPPSMSATRDPAVPALAASAASAPASPPSGDLWEPIGREPAAEGAAAATARQAAKLKAERDARARMLREQRALAASQAQADAARRRVDEIRGRGLPGVAPPASAVAPAPARTVQERCLNLNVIGKAICEARECVRVEHAGEPICQRIRAADDRRREQ